MNFRKHFLVALTLSFGLVGCGGSEPAPNAMGLDSSLGGLESGITPLDGGITPLEGMTTTPDAYDPVYDLPAQTAPVVDPALTLPAETIPAEPVADTLPAETLLTDTIPADDLGDIGDGLGDLPGDLDVLPPFNPGGGDAGEPSFSLEDSYLIDQDTFNQWQAVNLVSDGSNLYVAAVDQKTPSKGTVIQMDSSGGSWKDIGKSFLSTITFGAGGYDMEKTIQALALDSGGNLLVLDESDRVYKMPSPDYDIQEIELGLRGTMDATFVNGNYYLSTQMGVQKLDTSLGIPAAFSSVTPSGGLGADAEGNIFVVAGMSIQKISATGSVKKVISGLEAPIDVAVDNEGDIFVLTVGSVKWFSATGEDKGAFGLGEFIAPRAICTDASGTVFVADFGTDHKDSKIFKFTKSSGGGGFDEGLDSGLDSDLSDLSDLDPL